jgi:DNA excision repair protein ERCC-2
MSAGVDQYPDKRKPIAVRALAAFSAKTGSLDRRFTPGPTALEGIEGHQLVASRRSEDYQTEISLNLDYKTLHIRGRADGYDPGRHCLEEIKTFYGDFEKIPPNHRELHWAQAKLYGWMLCEQQGFEQINLALVYFHVGDQKEHRIEDTFTAQELKSFGSRLADIYHQWQLHIDQRMQALQPWLEQLTFPYEAMHSSQRQMAEAVYKAAATGRVLLAEAPTGTGKTLASIFPALKAMAKTPVDKIFYLTAKSTGKHLALENIQLIATPSDTPLRALELTAQQKACFEPDKQCNGESCPFALDFYRKLPAAREAASNIPVLDQATLATLAREHQLCPFYLSMEMSRWVDLVVADFNYYFDGNPLLLALTNEFDWKPYLLIDESHNLLDRGRQMFTASLNRGLLRGAKQQAPKKLKTSLERINRIWRELIKSLESQDSQFTIINVPSDKFNLALLAFTNDYVELLQQQPEHPMQHTQVQDFFFEALNYQLVLELVDYDYCVDMQNTGSKDEIITLRNLIPARLLAQRLAAAHSACFFSATLQPAYFYHTLLGLPDDAVHIQVESPFAAEQLQVNIAQGLSTRYKDRQQSVQPICNLVEKQLQTQPGNALIFFSSYEFLQQVKQQLEPQLAHLDVQLLTQARNMSESDRQDFLQQFSQHRNLLGLAVLGGSFSEGVDLAGDDLTGVFIATLGLPQVNPVNEYMRQFFQKEFQQGYNFTYLYPGLQKVIQAAGRVIRTRKDTGYLWLLDERFGQREIQALLPAWWKI